GGTHVVRTGDIGLVKIVSEQGVAAGVRRIEALTAGAAKSYLDARAAELAATADMLKIEPLKLSQKITTLMEDRRSLERSVTELKRKLAMGADAGEAGEETIGDVRVLTRKVDGVAPRDLRGLVDAGKSRLGSGVVAIVGVSDDGKAGISVGVTDDLTGRLSAVDLVRLGAAVLGGKGGGGRPDMAQAGGPDGTRAQAALEAIKSHLRDAGQ
ncbi:MAG: DHHA1 domain-containing protein, partial [Hyphomicrobiales bacterium]